jgi:hypothetical protein
MTHQRDEARDVGAESLPWVWVLWQGRIIMVQTVAALASEHVPDLVLSYLFTYHAEETLS